MFEQINSQLRIHLYSISSLLIFSAVLGQQKGLKSEAAWKNIFFSSHKFSASSYLFTSQWPEIILKSHNSHLLVPYIKLTRAIVSFTNKASLRLFLLFLGGKQVTEQTSRRRWKRMHHPQRWKLQNAIKASVSGFSPNTELTRYFHCFSGPFISADTRTHQRSNTQLLDGWEFAGAAGICCLRNEWISSRASCWNKKGLMNRRQKTWPPKTWRKSKLLLYLFFCYCSCIYWTVQGTNNAWGGWCCFRGKEHVESKEFCYTTWYLKSYFMQCCLPYCHPAAQTFLCQALWCWIRISGPRTLKG